MRVEDKPEKRTDWQEPPRIQALHDRYQNTGSTDGFSPAELTLILHLLDTEQKAKVAPVIQEMSKDFWSKHMPVRRVHYRNVVDVPSPFRRDVAEFISPKPGDEIVDLGSGTFAQVESLAARTHGLGYIGIDRMPEDDVRGTLDTFVADGLLRTAEYVQHDLTKGFPSLPEKKGEGERVGIAVASISYFPADSLQRVIEEGFEKGKLDRINFVALRPDFNADNLIDKIEGEYAKDLVQTEEGRQVLKLAREGYDAVRKFGEEIGYGLPVRSPQETSTYINRVAHVTEVVNDLSTETFGLVIKP